jgi:hypothetical protein
MVSDLQGYFDAAHGFCNILKTSKPNPLEILLVGSWNARLQSYFPWVQILCNFH